MSLTIAPSIPDYDLVRSIGKGGYGEVWLARSITGNYRAIKIVHRERFKHARPFEREFLGMQRFEPLSRMHPGLVSVLHVGRNETAGHFHYVMEIADDVVRGQKIDPAEYVPKTLSEVLEERHRLSIREACQLGLALADALGFLHKHGLVHRDIKPSNIIFVSGAPKFADVGLVAEIGDNSSNVGTVGYIPREGSGTPRADLYSLGMVLYQAAMGLGDNRFPELPANVAEEEHILDLFLFNEFLLKACDPDCCARYQSAEEMKGALQAILDHPKSDTPQTPASVSTVQDGVAAESRQETAPAQPFQTRGAAGAPARTLAGLRVAVLYKGGGLTDGRLLKLLEGALVAAGCDVFYDKRLAIGVEWAREIESRIRNSDAAIVLLSESSIQSEMIAYEVEFAHQCAQQQHGIPRLMPVRIQLPGPLPSPLATLLHPLEYFLWEGAQDDQKLLSEIIRSLESSPPSPSPAARVKLESIGGAVPLESRFYVVRGTDEEFQNALARRDSIVLVKGARQMGKTSVLARGLQQARQSGAKVALTDFQKLNANHLASVEAFYLTLGEFLADQLDLLVLPEDVWDKRRSPNTNFERYLRREVLGKLPGHFVWGLDEVDRLFTCAFGSEVFGLFRAWHNERALDPHGPWSRMTLAIAYATEAHLFITDVNQSPFNVGTRLTLEDFDLKQVMDLNHRYGSPLASDREVQEFFSLVGGQPYLVRRGFNELAAGNVSFEEFKASADRDEGVFGDHLRRILVLLAKDAEMSSVVRGILRGHTAPNSANFYRLRSAGLMRGDSPQDVRPRCQIYMSYLKRHLE